MPEVLPKALPEAPEDFPKILLQAWPRTPYRLISDAGGIGVPEACADAEPAEASVQPLRLV